MPDIKTHQKTVSMSQTSRQLCVIAGAALLSAAMWFWVQVIVVPLQVIQSEANGVPRGNLSDLYPRWLGARELLLHHRDPYAADITREIQIGYYGRPLDATRPNDPKDQQGFAYPVYVVFVLAPIVQLPFPVVQKAFFWLLVLATAGSVLLWMHALNWRSSIATKLLWIVVILGCFPAVQGLKLQQLTVLVAALLAACMCAIVRQRLVVAGVLLAVASIKPQLTVLLILWLCIWVTGDWRARGRLLWSFAVSMGLLCLASEWMLPGWIGKFRVASAAYYQYTGGGRSVLDVLMTAALGRFIAILAVAMCIAFAWKTRNAAVDQAEFRWSMCLVLATTLAIIPMFAPYNQLLLLPVLMELSRHIRRLWKHSRVLRFLVAGTGIAVLWPWLTSLALVLGFVVLPASFVQKAWPLPLYTTLAIPVMTFGLVLVSRNIIGTPKDDASAPPR